MRSPRQIRWAWLLALVLMFGPGGDSLWGQTNRPASDSKDAEAKDSSSRIISSTQVDQELNNNGSSLLDSLRANRTDYPRLSPEIRRKLLDFKRQRDRYLKEQEDLIKRFKGATDADRDRIRERLQDRRLQWLEQSRNYRETARERLRDLLRELPKHQEALEAARENVQNEVREIRERPRTD